MPRQRDGWSTGTTKNGILKILEAEYCAPADISVEALLEALAIPPLGSVVRCHEKITADNRVRLEKDLRGQLEQENHNRLSSDHSIALDLIPELETWMCKLDEALENSACDPAAKDLSSCVNWGVVDIATAESCLRGSNVFAPGVLAFSSSIKKGDRVHLYVDLSETTLRGSLARPQTGFYLGSGTAEISRHDLFTSNKPPSGVAVLVDRPVFAQLSLNNFGLNNKQFVAQNLPSCVAVHVLDAQPDDVVLDACAAPGGKSLHIAKLLGGTGKLYLVEKSRERADKMRLLFLNTSNVTIINADSSKLSSVENQMFEPEMFDRILVDAPCSASGLRPRLSLKSLHVKQLDACPVIQKRILRSVILLLKVGGILVYSTCSILQRENENVVGWVLEKFGGEMELVAQTPFVFGSSGFKTLGLSAEQSQLLQRFHVVPSRNRFDTIGFFIAKFVRRK